MILPSTFDNVEIDVLEVAATWSYWDGEIPRSIPREVALPRSLSDELCVVVQGVRRCGKSTLLQQLVRRYDLDPARCAFLNFEDPRLSNSLSYPLLDRLVKQFRERHRDAPRLVYFLDEVQSVEGWQRWLRTRLERPDGSVFVVTGSNATLLSGELASALTGRHLTIELYPFHLSEVQVLDRSVDLEGYLRDGGFPAALRSTDGDRLLRQYFHDIVERDVRERISARSSRPIRQVVQMAYEAAGSEMSLRRIAGATGIAVETASSYLEASESAYLLFGVPYFAYSERKRAARNRKYYPVDTGLRRVVVTRTGLDRGKALECATHLALRRRYDDVFYWRGKREVDFVVQAEGAIVPVQVTWEGPTERHHRALEEFYEHFPQAAEPLMVTADTFEQAFG